MPKKGKRSDNEESDACSTVFEQLGSSAGMCFKHGDIQDEIGKYEQECINQ